MREKMRSCLAGLFVFRVSFFPVFFSPGPRLESSVSYLGSPVHFSRHATSVPHLSSLMFRRLRRLLDNRRYRDAAFARPDLRRRTEATSYERVVRALRGREQFGYDDAEANAGRFVRTCVAWVIALLLLWFTVRSLLALDVFAG